MKFSHTYIIWVISYLGLAAGCLATTHYVATNGASVPPYTNWAGAATNMQDAVNIARTNTAPKIVWVSNGVYFLTNQVTVDSAVTMASVNGRDVTIVDGNWPNVTNRCFIISQNAVLDGFTVRNGYRTDYAGGIYAGYALIKNCRITANVASNSSSGQGGGVYLVSGVISNCDIVSNYVWGRFGGGLDMASGYTSLAVKCTIAGNTFFAAGEAKGVGVYAYGVNAVISNCLIYGNVEISGGTYGGGVCLEQGASIYNSLIYANCAGQGGGIAAYASAVTIKNCTVVSNYPSGAGYKGGLLLMTPYPQTTYVENVISYLNTGDWASNIYVNTSGSYSGYYHVVNSCIAPTNSFGVFAQVFTNNIQANPRFADKDNYNFRLTRDSPGVNAGINEAWMNSAVDLDGHSRIDRFSGIVDMGCYEFLLSGTMIDVH